MARVLLVGGGCRGLRLARALCSDGHAVRVSTRSELGRLAIEAAGAECWIATPDRVGTLRYALENVTVLGWLLGTASGEDEERLAALHGSRLDFMLTQLIDTTVRGLLYEARGTLPQELLAGGAARVRRHCEHNAIPYTVLDADPGRSDAWAKAAETAVRRLLGAAIPAA